MFNLNEKQRFSLRKLSVGLASVLIGISFASATGNSAKADTVSVQTSVAETSKNNKVDANADASKEVAKSTNSVDSNKLSPSQTVLNKQVTSNDALKGTDAKQEQVVESDQNSVAEQNNLLDDLGKQKTSAQSGDQAEAKNQENRLVDQINYKLTNNTSTDNKEDLGQNKVAPDETKQAPTTKSDAEKSTVSSSSTQQVSDQSNNHAEDNSQTQLNITKNSQQLDQKELATNLTQDNSSQKDYTPDISAWTGHDDGTYYILDKYTPQNDTDKSLIVIPNEADFEKAGKSTNGHEVGINANTMRSIVISNNPKEIHFSETNNQKIKAIDDDWSNGFNLSYNDDPEHNPNVLKNNLEAITGKSFDTSNIHNMSGLFWGDTKLKNISALSSWNVSNTFTFYNTFRATALENLSALTNWNIKNATSFGSSFMGCKLLKDISGLSNWNTSNLNNISNTFMNCSSLNDLSPLSKWDTANVWNFGHMFSGDNNLTSLDALKNWNTSKVKFWDNMFKDCTNLNNINAINNWNYSSAQANPAVGAYSLDDMFNGDHKIQINIGTDSGLADFIRRTGRIDAFHNSSNQITTSNTKLIELLTNTDFKAQNETTTAKRTITFSGLPANSAIPPIVQVINYTKLANAIIDMTDTSDANAHGKIISSGFEKDWKLDTSKQNDDVIIDGVICFKPVKIPHINGYKSRLIKDPVNPTAFLVSFMAVPEQPQNNQSNNVQSSQKPAQPEQNQPEPIQTKPVDQQEDKEVAQILNHISYTLMHNDSSNTADSFEPAQTDSAPLETADVTQKVTPKPAKPTSIETQVPVKTHNSLSNYTLTTNDPIPDTLVFNNIKSNELTWQIDNENLNNNSINVPYYVTNTIYKLHLPRFSNYKLHLIKCGTTQDSVSFVYVNKQTQLNYVFNLKIQDNKYYLTVGKIDRVSRKIMPIKTYNVISYQDLLDIFDKYFK